MGTNERYDEVGIPEDLAEPFRTMRTQKPSGVSFRRRTDVGTSSRSGGQRTPRRAPSESSTRSSTSSRSTHPRDLDVAPLGSAGSTREEDAVSDSVPSGVRPARLDRRVPSGLVLRRRSMRWDGVVVRPYLGPVGLALYVLFYKGPGQRVPSACPSGHEECAQADRPKECPSEIRVESTSLGSRRLQLINDQPSDSNRREDGGDREDAVVEHITP